jgi:hypothetical protein
MILDIGSPDSVFVGSLDGTPIHVWPGDIARIPVWVKNDESVPSLSIAFATDDVYVVQRLGGNLIYPLTSWDDCGFLAPVIGQPGPGYTTQSLTGWSDLVGGSNPLLNSQGSYLQICEISMVMNSDIYLLGDTTWISLGFQPRIGGAVFSDSVGTGEWNVNVVLLPVILGPPECDYIPGDINNNGSANGVDVMFGVAYLKGDTVAIPPDTCLDCPSAGDTLLAAGDVNGNCQFNGIDITFYVAYLKSELPALLYCVDCPPVGRRASPPAPAVRPIRSPQLESHNILRTGE